MLLTNWLKSIASHCRPFRPRHHRHQRSRVLNRYQPALSRQMIGCEHLEDRTMLTSVISIDDVTIEEDAGLPLVYFTLTRTGINPGDLNSRVEIDFTTQDETANGYDVDYNSVTGSLSFSASTTATTQTTTMSVLIHDDLEVEGNETFQLLISTTSPNTIIEKNIGIATIIDNEAVSLSVSDATAYENDTLSFEITLNQVASSDITFLATTVAGSAEEGGFFGDYTYFENKLVTIKAGEISTTVTVHPLDDDDKEPDETFSLVISDPKINGDSLPSTLIISDDTGMGTILNDDYLPGSTFNIEGTKIIEGHDGTDYLEFTITRTGESAGDLNFFTQVLFNTIDGTATAGEDYASTVRVLDFNASPSATRQSQTVEVPIFGDTHFEATETFLGRLSNATGGSVLKGNGTTLDATGVITNDESDFSFQQELKADIGFANHSYDHAGRYFAIDGNVLVIGVPNNIGTTDNGPGLAYVYTRNQHETPEDSADDTWDFQTILRHDNRSDLEYFGASVAIHDDTILIGAFLGPYGDSSRIVYIFSRDGDDWVSSPPRRESILIPRLHYHSRQATSLIAVYEETIVVGNYVFEKTGVDWSAPAMRKLTEASVTSVTIQENTIVIGTAFDSEEGSRAGAVLIYTKTGNNWTSIAPHEVKLTASDAKPNLHFGQSVALNGNQLAVGATNTNTGSYSGQAYIFTQSGSDWSTLPTTEVIFPREPLTQHFGASIALTDTHLVVGTFRDVFLSSSSEVYVYTKNGANWDPSTASRTVLNAPVSGNVLFGESVAVSGTTILAGASRVDTESIESGMIYGFELDQNDSYQLIHEISHAVSQTAHNGGDRYGRRIVIGEKYMLIAAPGTETGSANGVVYLYAKDDGNTLFDSTDDNWIYETTFTAPDPELTTGFGHSIDIDGNTLLIAAQMKSGFSEVYSYEMTGDDWSTFSPQITPLLSRTGTFISWYPDGALNAEDFVAIENDTILVSDPFSTTDPSEAGQVYVFTRNGNDWSTSSPTRSVLKASDTTMKNNFGYAIDIDGDKIIVGAYRDESYRGAAYLYLKGEDGWENAVEIKLTGYDSRDDDLFGTSVAIDGNTIVISAIRDSDSGFFSGSIYIFDGSKGWDNPKEYKVIPAKIYNHDKYIRVASNTQDFGGSVDIDGTTIVVGASSTSPESNSVYIYDGSDGWDQIQESRINLPEVSELYDRGLGSTVAFQNNNLLVALLDKHFNSDISRVYSYTRPPDYNNLVQSETIIPPAPTADSDHFGNEIEVDGDYMIVAAIDSDLRAPSAGAVYIYHRNDQNTPYNDTDDTWDYHSTLTLLEAGAGDQFGSSISIDGDTLVIGAYLEDALGKDSGAAYVYRLNGSIWEFEEKLTASDGEPNDHFGSSVSIENDTIIVGASFRNSDSPFDRDDGAVYVFNRSGSNWSESQILTASNHDILDRFGSSAVIHNGTIFISAVGAKAAESPEDAGAIYIFHQAAGIWHEAQILGPPDGEHNDLFGSDLHVDGDHLGVVAFGDDDNKGSAYLFVNNAGIWEFQQKLTPPESDDADRSVFSIRISGSTLVIGSQFSDGKETDSGAAFLYRLINDEWVQSQTLFAEDGVFQDFFGYAVAFSDSEVIVGAPLNDEAGDDIGKFYVFRPFTPEIVISDVIQAEGDEPHQTVFTFNIERRGQVVGDLNFDSMVDFTTLDLSAKLADHDYAFKSGTVTFLADPDAIVQTQTITVLVNGDYDYEGSETFLVHLTNPSSGTVLKKSVGLGIIEDDDLTVLNIEDITIEENAETAILTVSLDQPLSNQIQVDYSTANQSAMSPSHYLATSGTLTFEPGETSKTISVSIVDNSIVGAEKSFLVNLTNLQSNGLEVIFENSQAVVTIHDDDQSSVSINDVTVDETAGTATLTVSLSQPVETTVNIDFSTIDQSASNPDDYLSQSGTLSFTPGEQSKTITISIVDTNLVEIDETFLVKLSNIQASGANIIFTDDQGEVTIQDDDRANLSISDLTINESAGTASITVTLDEQVDTSVSVEFVTSDQSAIAPGDYLHQSDTLIFNPGESSKTIEVPIVNSDLIESDESFFVNLSNLQANGRSVNITDHQAEITILDDDHAKVSVNDVSINENEGTATLTVSLDQPLFDQVQVDFATIDQSALNPDHYLATSGTLIFNAGEQSKTITVSIIDNDIVEAEKSFLLKLSNLQSASQDVLLEDSEAIVKIHDDDQSSVSINDVTVDETAGTATLTVSLSQPVETTVNIDFSTIDQSASNPDDYLSQSGTLSFTPGEQSKTITISIVDTNLVEIDETFLVKLSNIQASGANIIFTDDQGEVTIQDDDRANLSISDLTINESAGTASITVTLDEQVDTSVSVEFVTSDQSAIAPGDYLHQSDTLIFNPGESSKTIEVPIVNSDLIESDESFFVNLSNLQANGRSVNITDHQAEITILDDDHAKVSVNDVSVDEAIGTATVIVTLDKPVDTSISIDFATADQTAINSEDYLSQSGTLIFNPGEQSKTITVSIVDTDLIEADEMFLISLSNLQANDVDVIVEDDQSEVTITDNDQAGITINNLSINESVGTATLTVSLDKPVATSVSVDFATANQTANNPDDYLTQTGTLTFNPGEQTKTIAISLVDNDLLETDEAFLVNLTNIQANGADVIFTDNQAEVTIVDDDDPFLSISDLTVNETEGTAFVIVSLEKPVDTSVSVDFITADQSALNSIDYLFQSGTLIFDPGEQSKTIEISILDNSIVEGLETFLVNLRNMQTSSPDVILVDDQAEITIVDDDQAMFSIDDLSVDETAGTAKLKVSLNRPVHTTVSVDFSTADNSASNFTDYLSQAGTLTFFPGQQSKYITIPILDSSLVEGTEQFFVNLTNIQANGAQVTFADDQSEVTIMDDDQANLSINDLTVNEDVGTITLTVSLDQPVQTAINFDFSTADQSAFAPSDYLSHSGTLTFNAGEQTKTITISIIDSDLVELDETFLVKLSNLQTNGADILLIDDQAEVTVIDDDQARITINDISVDEHAGTATVAVSLDQPVDSAVSVDFTTADQSANQTNDYLTSAGTLTFNSGEQSKTITISIVDSDLLERDETFLVNLSNIQAGGRDVIFADDQAEVTIIDDETATARVDLRVVHDPTNTRPNGEAGSLPDNVEWVKEWSSYWVEVWVDASSSTHQGIFSVQFNLDYNTEYTSATEIQFGASFTQNQAGSINDTTGAIEGLFAETNTSDLGSNDHLLFARIKFEPLAEDQVELDYSGKNIGPYDLGFNINSAQVHLVGEIPATTISGQFDGVSIWANPYDLNDDDAINFRDLMLFASVYNTIPSESSSDYSWFADLNQSDRVNFKDLVLFASNYGKRKLDHPTIVYPQNFPHAWNNQLLVDTTQGEPQLALETLSQSTADSALNNVVEHVSPQLNPSQNETLEQIDIQVVDLEGNTLGRAVSGTIYIDANAAGYGWFVDATPGDNSEFQVESQLSLIALPDTDAAGRVDLWSVIMHELGHLLGFEHENEGLMQDTLPPGVRRLPDWELNIDLGNNSLPEEADSFFLTIQDETELVPF
ncbi:Calx-beta domain-containing protein [Gimesia aquarii]|uniref:Calx-beta domain protein n=1 Tax=Gimesia aquarii TaxID=2527964 RepID=A0A517X313_9PLAN|nr:Calx-beta domain-containing protein [Gimesia aquarii]QDU11901.1 Calx-beta domain protein [Gimesia aquarii]